MLKLNCKSHRRAKTPHINMAHSCSTSHMDSADKASRVKLCIYVNHHSTNFRSASLLSRHLSQIYSKTFRLLLQFKSVANIYPKKNACSCFADLGQWFRSGSQNDSCFVNHVVQWEWKIQLQCISKQLPQSTVKCLCCAWWGCCSIRASHLLQNPLLRQSFANPKLVMCGCALHCISVFHRDIFGFPFFSASEKVTSCN